MTTMDDRNQECFGGMFCRKFQVRLLPCIQYVQYEILANLYQNTGVIPQKKLVCVCVCVCIHRCENPKPRILKVK
jgi:hypothetical protein